MRDIVILERGYPGGGATGRNVARIRAMQLTEELTHVALACQAKYDRMGEELGFNVLFYRLGYAWVLYDADEVERMRSIVEMHHRIGVGSQFLSPDDTLRRLPILRGGDPVAGAVLNDDAIVHHDAVVWAHLEHLAGTSVRILPGVTVQGIVTGDAGVEAVETDRGRIATRAVLNAAGGWSTQLNALAGVSAPNRPLRREVLVTAPVQRSIEAAVTFYRPNEGWFNQTLRGEIVMGVTDPAEASGVNQGSSWDFLRRTAVADDPEGAGPRGRLGHPPVGRHVRRQPGPPAAGRADAPTRRLVAGERLERPRDAAGPVPGGAPGRAVHDRGRAGPTRDVRPGPVRPGPGARRRRPATTTPGTRPERARAAPRGPTRSARPRAVAAPRRGRSPDPAAASR